MSFYSCLEYLPVIIIGLAMIIRVVGLLKNDAQSEDYACIGQSPTGSSDCYYIFRIKRRLDGYRCYIVRTPSFRGRSTSAHTIHYLTDSAGKYICFTAKINKLQQAQTLCRTWADQAQKYIETGRPFS